MDVSEAIQGLTPQAVWEHFARIAAIPRPSKKEEKVAAHVLKIARENNLRAERDATGNIAVRKPPSPGKEASPMVALQSHLDMVCEKDRASTHDFDADGIQLVRSNGYIHANGTTLGSDNGIGVAVALSVMLDKSLVHGPLEFLFTVDEETGLTGASGLRPGFLKSRLLLNLDSEEDGAVYVGCSGGRDTVFTFRIRREPVPPGYEPLGFAVRGLRGGHSGLDINAGRGNAIKLMARALWAIGNSNDIRIAAIEVGSKRNAIPREAEILLYIHGEHSSAVRTEVEALNTIIKSEYSTSEPSLALELVSRKPSANERVLAKADQERLLSLLVILPHGVLAMSVDIPGLVETSTNVATIQSEPEAVVVATSQRSSVKTALDDVINSLRVMGKLVDADVKHSDGYPGWKPNLDSHALKVTRETYMQLYGREPAVKAIHAGLECGVIGEKYPGIDMVSFGPTIEGAHSPRERVEIATVQRFWNLLVGVLKNLS